MITTKLLPDAYLGPSITCMSGTVRRIAHQDLIKRVTHCATATAGLWNLASSGQEASGLKGRHMCAGNSLESLEPRSKAVKAMVPVSRSSEERYLGAVATNIMQGLWL